MTRFIVFAFAGLMIGSPLAMAQDHAAVPAEKAPAADAAAAPEIPKTEAPSAVDKAVTAATNEEPTASPPQEEHAAASHAETELPDVDWPFSGPFGAYDKAALQRGFQVYKQVCSACHSMNLLHYRNLAGLGYNEDEIKSVAAEYTVMDGPNDEGEMYERPARPSDPFKAPYENVQAAKYANNGALPPDLSLITKAREGGASYVYGILTGFAEPPAGTTLLPGQHWNKQMPGHVIAMPPPLSDGMIAYENADIPQTTAQYAKDVASFLTWAAEPEMEVRKQTGIKAIIFLAIFAGLMYAVKRKLWAKLH